MRGAHARAEGHLGTHRPKVRAMRRAKLRGAGRGPKDFVTAARVPFKGGSTNHLGTYARSLCTREEQWRYDLGPVAERELARADLHHFLRA